MAVFISHQSALRYWLTKTGNELLPCPSSVTSLAFADASMRTIRHEALPLDFSEKRPLHVLVPNSSGKRGHADVVTHVWSGPIPKGAFYELQGAVYVSSPEFTFLQLATRRPLISTIELGCHLCGEFAIGDEGRGYAGRREHLTTPGDIETFVRSTEGVYGARPALRALRHVVPFTASPMEVLLIMVFTLPPRLGGWGFPEVVANQRIEVDERLRPLVGASYLRGDLFFPSVRGNVEYDSYEFHTGRFCLDHTQTRRNVLEAMGVRTVSATWGQISGFESLETFVWMTRERFDMRRRSFTEGERDAQRSLHEFLIDGNRLMF